MNLTKKVVMLLIYNGRCGRFMTQHFQTKQKVTVRQGRQEEKRQSWKKGAFIWTIYSIIITLCYHNDLTAQC